MALSSVVKQPLMLLQAVTVCDNLSEGGHRKEWEKGDKRWQMCK